MFELGVVGGGPAGVTVALRARELGATVSLIERKNMGGTCRNIFQITRLDDAIPTDAEDAAVQAAKAP
jgi:flavin-dependent dehydrogenase